MGQLQLQFPEKGDRELPIPLDQQIRQAVVDLMAAAMVKVRSAGESGGDDEGRILRQGNQEPS
jgi:hypothetical protein